MKVHRLAQTLLGLSWISIGTLHPSRATDSHFELRVQSAAPARFNLTDAAGRAWTPANAIAYERRTENHFVTRSGFEIDLPPGAYTLVAERGPEYRPFRATIQAQAGQQTTVRVVIPRWLDMNQRGWYSGDLHNHRRVEDMPLLMLAEDLNLTPAITDWVWDNSQRAPASQTSEPIRYVDPTHVYSVLDKEVERLKAGPGAVDLLGLRSSIPFDGYSLYPPNDKFARQAHAQGGWVDAEKIVWRDIAALVALGHVDFAGIVHNHFNRQDVELETDAWGMIPKDRPEYKTPAGMPLWSMNVYYRFLNCGFRLPVSAGSATGVKASPLGYNRVYVNCGRQFDYDTWFRRLKEGRSFATNGPMLFLYVDGQEPGGILRLPKGTTRRVRITAEASSLNPMDRLEIVFKGRTIRTVSGSGKLAVTFDTQIAETGWIAARAFEKPDRTIRFAHTSPVYVEIPGDAGIVRDDVQFCIDWIDREMAFYKNLPGFREPSHRAAMLELFASARQVYEKLRVNLPALAAKAATPLSAGTTTAAGSTRHTPAASPVILLPASLHPEQHRAIAKHTASSPSSQMTARQSSPSPLTKAGPRCKPGSTMTPTARSAARIMSTWNANSPCHSTTAAN